MLGEGFTVMADSPAKPAYAKPWFSCADQVALLQSRGLIVGDVGRAAEFLSHINYYRFSGYCLAFEQPRHRFVDGTTFERVRESYEFDRYLRDLVTEALELIELDIRTATAHHFGRAHGVFGHTLAISFFARFDHATWLKKLRDEATRSHEPFVLHFKENYAGFPDLPVWMMTEVVSFGALSIMFKGMRRADQRAIASRYGLQPLNLQSWLHHLVYVRNLCAHHSRIWDREWSIKAALPEGNAWRPPFLPGNDRLFATLLMLFVMLRKCPAVAPFDEEWKARLHAQLANPPDAPAALSRMGMTKDWAAHPLWK